MKTFIVAYISQFENQLKQTKIIEDSPLNAMLMYLSKYEDLVFEDGELQKDITEEEFKELMFDMDSNISAIEI